MKLLHTSDWHLGAMDGERSLLEDQKYFIDEICNIISDQAIDAVIIAGDVYDRSVSSAEAIKLYDYAMTRICGELNKTVIVIAGNHDSAERLSTCKELLSSAGLYISGSLENVISKIDLGNVEIYLLPWITEEKVKSIYPEKKDNINSLEDAYRVVTDDIRQHFDLTKKHIIVSHAFITNSETSTSDRAAEIGFATQVSANVFDEFDYVALGHIHKPQNVKNNIRYSGTPMPYSFGKEETQEKSVTIIDTEDLSQSIVPLNLLHQRKTLSGTLEELLDYKCTDDIKNGYLKLQINDQYVGLETLSELKKVYPNLIEVSGKTFEGDGKTVTLSLEELEQLEANPIDVFKHFCKEEMDFEPSEHIINMFEEAINDSEEENQ